MCHADNEERKTAKRIELPSQEKSECLVKREITSTLEYWKRTSSNNREKNLKRVSQEDEKAARNEAI